MLQVSPARTRAKGDPLVFDLEEGGLYQLLVGIGCLGARNLGANPLPWGGFLAQDGHPMPLNKDDRTRALHELKSHVAACKTALDLLDQPGMEERTPELLGIAKESLAKISEVIYGPHLRDASTEEAS